MGRVKLATAGDIAAAAEVVYHELRERQMPINCANALAKLLDIKLRALEHERRMFDRATGRE